jgi:hypothetical protein
MKTTLQKLLDRLSFLEKMVHVSPYPEAVKRSIEDIKISIAKLKAKTE